MHTYILGITISVHDSAACLLKDGELVAACEEEKFTRNKHTGEFPFRAIKFCMEREGISIDDISYVAYSQVPWLFWPSKLGYALLNPKGAINFLKKEIFWYSLNYEKTRVWIDRFKDAAGAKKHYKEIFVEHHLAHAASACLLSHFDESAVLSIDQRGEWSSTMLAKYSGNKIFKIKEIDFPNSLGLFYLMLTLYLGFDYNDEYQVMGLAAYGKPRYLNEMNQIMHYTKDGEFRLNKKYLSGHYKRMYSDELIKKLGPPRKKEEPITERHCDIAASLQITLENVSFKILNYLYKITKSDKLCLAGGVALNSVMNGKIVDNTPFKEVFIQPAASDAGTAVGAALYVHNILLDKPKKLSVNKVYLGPEFSNEKIEKMLKSYNLKYEFLGDNLEPFVAKLISEGKVIGWFQGRVEFGPRALGNRSILADPRRKDMKDRVNLLVKERQSFRPFAPAILEERFDEYFTGEKNSPYMLLVHGVRLDKKDNIPAVVHVDGTARVQTVSKSANPRFWKLITEFERLTGIPILLNTSFNIKGEPIVCTPQDAIRCFFSSGLDGLVLNNFLLTKQ